MKYPVIILKRKDPSIYYCNESKFALCSKGGESFYQKGVIIDAEGKRYELRPSKAVKRAPFLTSLRYVQQMFVLDVKYQYVDELTLDEFKL